MPENCSLLHLHIKVMVIFIADKEEIRCVFDDN